MLGVDTCPLSAFSGALPASVPTVSLGQFRSCAEPPLPVQRISLRGAQTPGDPKQTFVVQGRTQVLQKMQGRSCVRREELTRVVRQELGTQVLGHFSRKLRPISWSQQRSRRCNYRRSRDATSRCSRKVDETSGIGHRKGNRQRVIRNTEQGPGLWGEGKSCKLWIAVTSWTSRPMYS